MAPLSHMVYFSLHEPTPANVQGLVSACHRYLAGHTGVVYFAVGTLNRQLTRPVNDLDYDVALHVVFDSKESHDKYQIDPRHLQFIEEQKPGWKRVRVFDSDLIDA
jgi:hypothetical protein